MFIFIEEHKKQKTEPKIDYASKISKALQNLIGRYSYHVIFSDWVEMMALAISNASTIRRDALWQTREKRYMELAKRYTAHELEELSKMYGMLVIAFDAEFDDYLGKIFMEADIKDARNGQFFTPFSLSELNAELIVPTVNDEKIKVNEPTCGAGGMIIALAKTLKDKKINYQRKLKVIAQDLDWTAVHMCYVQLSLIGVNAVVCQGNTLEHINISEYPESHRLYTPNARGMLL